MIKLIAKFLIAISSNQHPGQVALSLVLGMILGLTPFLMPHNLLVLFIIILLRVNFSAVLVAWVVFSGISYAVDPFSHQLGLWVLQQETLQALFTEWYNSAAWRLMAFNNTVVMGSVLIAYALSLPMYVIFLLLIKKYRASFLVWVNKFKLVKMLKAANGAKVLMG